jgi:hypothetical protein
MKKRLVLTMLCALTLGSIGTSLVSCGGNTQTVVPAVTAATITNKDALQAKWKVGQDNRRVSLSATPDGSNIADSIADGSVKLESSDANIVAVLGQYLVPVGAGTATISVKVTTTDKDNKATTTTSDTVDITILAADTVDYNILNVSDVLEKDNNKKYAFSVVGKIQKWTKGTDGSAYGNFYLEDLKDATKSIQVYGATASISALAYNSTDEVYKFTNPKDFLTNEVTKKLAVGDTVYCYVIRADYNGTKEVNAIVSNSVSEVMAYENSAATAYNVTGKLTSWKGTATDGGSYGNFNITDLTDSTKSILVYGATADPSALAYDTANSVYKFTNPKNWLTNDFTSKITIGDTLNLRVIRADFKGTLELVAIVLGSAK